MSKIKAPKPVIKQPANAAASVVLKPTSTTASRCSSCISEEVEGINLTYFKFKCDHWFHAECYEILKGRFGGSMCPICFNDERFQPIVESVTLSAKRKLFFDIDHFYGRLCCEYFVENDTKVWINLTANEQLNDTLELSAADISTLTFCDGKDAENLLERNEIKQKMRNSRKAQAIMAAFADHKKSVEEIVQLHSIDEIKRSKSLSLNFLISNGYDIREIYDLGFRTVRDLCDLKFNARALSKVNAATGEVFVPISDLVDYYNIDFRTLISMICRSYSRHYEEDKINYKKSVLEFCRLHMSQVELRKLKLHHLMLLISPGWFTPDCLVEICQGYDMNDTHVLQTIFNFDANCIRHMVGFHSKHWEDLGWDETHPLRKAYADKTSQEYQRDNLISKNAIIKMNNTYRTEVGRAFQNATRDSDSDNSGQEEPVEADDKTDSDDDSDDDPEVPIPINPSYVFNDFKSSSSSVSEASTSNPISFDHLPPVPRSFSDSPFSYASSSVPTPAPSPVSSSSHSTPAVRSRKKIAL